MSSFLGYLVPSPSSSCPFSPIPTTSIDSWIWFYCHELEALFSSGTVDEKAWFSSTTDEDSETCVWKVQYNSRHWQTGSAGASAAAMSSLPIYGHWFCLQGSDTNTNSLLKGVVPNDKITATKNIQKKLSLSPKNNGETEEFQQRTQNWSQDKTKKLDTINIWERIVYISTLNK